MNGDTCVDAYVWRARKESDTNITASDNKGGKVAKGDKVSNRGVFGLGRQQRDRVRLRHGQSHVRHVSKVLLILLEVAARAELGGSLRPISRKRKEGSRNRFVFKEMFLDRSHLGGLGHGQ